MIQRKRNLRAHPEWSDPADDRPMVYIPDETQEDDVLDDLLVTRVNHCGNELFQRQSRALVSGAARVVSNQTAAMRNVK